MSTATQKKAAGKPPPRAAKPTPEAAPADILRMPPAAGESRPPTRPVKKEPRTNTVAGGLEVGGPADHGGLRGTGADRDPAADQRVQDSQRWPSRPEVAGGDAADGEFGVQLNVTAETMSDVMDVAASEIVRTTYKYQAAAESLGFQGGLSANAMGFYLDGFVQDCGNPTDPVQRVLLEEFAQVALFAPWARGRMQAAKTVAAQAAYGGLANGFTTKMCTLTQAIDSRRAAVARCPIQPPTREAADERP